MSTIGLLEVKSILTENRIKMAVLEHYQNRFVVRISKIGPLKHRILANALSTVYTIDEDIFVKIDLKWWEKYVIVLSGEKYWYKEYR